MTISGVHLLEKHGGKSGDFYFDEAQSNAGSV
jgi:molybdenum cofactor biosynthesis enzyme